jgi:hypothetical protein
MTARRSPHAAAAPGLPLRRALRSGLAGALVASGLVAGGLLSSPAQGTSERVPLAAPQLVRYSSAGSGTSRSGSQVVPAAAAPTPVANGRNVTISWPATTLSGGTPSNGYVVRRYNQSLVLQTIGSACQGVITATSCVEANVPTGTWEYTVQPSHFGWTGSASAFSAAITVGASSLAFTSSTTINTVPTTMTGTIAGFGGGTLAFHLDSATGTTLTGTPTIVPIGGAGSVTVTIPAGTTDGPHSVFAVDTLTNTASAAFTFVDPPLLTTMLMQDLDADGKIDTVKATFNKALAAYTAGTFPWTLTNVPSGGSLSGVSVSGATATLTIAEGPSAASTAVGTFTVALAQNSGGIRSVNGSLSSFVATAPADSAAPVILTMVMQDTTANGKVDAIAMTLSETVAAYSAGTTPWTLTGVPSAGTLASVTASGTTATLVISEGAGVADTTVGTFNVAVATSASGLRDAAGNLTAASRQPTDGAKPIRLTQAMYDVNLDGRIDRVIVTFTETLAAYTAANGSVTGSTATLDLNQGAAAATTALGSFKVALLANAAGIRDGAGNLSSYTAVAPTDLAAPAPITISLLDNSKNGKVDRVTVVFSETLAAYSAGTTPWTLANVPSAGTIASVTTATTTATILLTEGAGAVDTAVGSMTIAMAANAVGARDAAGNLSSFTPRTLLDKARPITALVSDTNGTTDGLIQPNDKLIFTFSEPLLATTVPTSTTVTLTDPSTTGNDTLTITGITSGARSTGSNGYLLTDNTVADFAASPVTLSADLRTITVTVGPTCTGTGCAGLGTVAANASFSYIAATTITDPGANVTLGTKSTAIRLF